MRRNDTERLIELFSKDTPFANAFECLFEGASDAIYILDARGNFVTINREAEELTGFKREDWTGKSFRKIIAPKSLPKAIKGFVNVIGGKQIRVELELKTAFKKTILVEVTSKPLIINGKAVGTLGIARNITERKQTEGALRRSEEKFRNIFEGASDAMIFLDRSGRILDVNRKAVQVFGGSRKKLLGKHFTKVGVFSLKEMPQLIANFAGIISGKKVVINLAIKNKKGQKIFLECSGSSVKLDEKLVGIMVIARDITERKKAEEEIEAGRKELKVYIESMVDGLCVNNTDGTIIRTNEAFAKIFGYKSPEGLIGKTIFENVAKREIPRLTERFMETVKKGEREIKSFEIICFKKGGSEFLASFNIRNLWKNGKYVGSISIARDITERKQMQNKLEEYSQQLEKLVEKRTRQLKEAHEQLLKAERLAAIGEMAAMVGHDLRNPLTGIAGATYYLKTKLGTKVDKKAREMLELVEKSIGYSNKIISDLLEYSREIRLELTETTLKPIIKDALTSVKIPKSIRILDLTENKPKIRVDIAKMERVFVNFIKNAIDAMSKGGTLTITSKESNGNLQIAFTDSGMGMPKEVMQKIWIPLFTTKAKGMGLGLPICKRIVEAHEGNISVESTVGKGTTITLEIPVKPKLEGGEKIWVNLPESLLSTTTKA